MGSVADIVGTLAAGVIEIDRDGVVVSANAAAEALGLGIGSRFTPGADQLVGGRILASAVSPGTTVVVLHDVTDRTIAARRAELAERRAEYSGTAGAIAHQINNPLGIINIHAELIKDDIITLKARHRDDAKTYGNVTESLEELESAVAAITQITANMRAFAQPMPTATHQLRRAIDWAVHTASPDLRDRAFAVTEFGVEGAVAIDEPELGRVLVHLLKNAARAIPTGNAPNHQITIATRAATDPTRVVVEVRDTGAGIAPAKLEKIFEPAISHRNGAIHIGLGLCECREILRAVGGDITIASELDAGTVVSIELPLRS